MDLNKIRRMAGVREKFGSEQLNEAEKSETLSLKDRHEILGDKNRKFILVTDPYGEELKGSPKDIAADIISVVDGPSFAQIFIGAAMGRGGENMGKMPNKENWTLYHYNQMSKALADANARLKKLDVKVQVTESFVEAQAELLVERTMNKDDLHRVIKALKRTADELEARADKEKDRGLRATYMKDADDYDKIAKAAEEGKHNQARRLYRKMDTAARDELFDLDFNKLTKRVAAEYLNVELLHESCGMSHSENEEVKEVECKICGWNGAKDEYYDHMHDEHAEVVKGPYDEEEDEEGCTAVAATDDASDDEIEIRFEGVSAVKKKLFKLWFGDTVEDVIKQARELSDEDLKFLHDAGKDRKSGGAQLVQKKTIEKEMKKRGFLEEGMKLDEAAKKKTAKKKTTKKSTKAEDATVVYNPSDVDESPESPMNDDNDKVKVPGEVKNALKAEIKNLRDEAEKIARDPVNRDDFYADCANAMEEILMHLDGGTEESFKKAQIFMAKLMGPITQRIPNVVYKFLTRTETSPKSLKDLFKEVKAKKK